MDWLLLFLLQLSDLTSAIDNPYLQSDTMVCTGRQALFRWKYKVKSFAGIQWIHDEKKIVSSPPLTFSPEVIISDQFKGRLTFNSTDPFSFTLEKATKFDNGMYECVFLFDDGNTDSLRGRLVVKDFHDDDNFLKKEVTHECVTLSCKADPPCKWTYPNGTTEVAKKIRYCSKEANVTIKSESDHVCKQTNYTSCPKTTRRRRSLDDKSSSSSSCDDCCFSNTKRRRRRSDDEPCSCEETNNDGTDPGTDPINPVPIVVGMLAAIIAGNVITVIIVFYKRRSRQQGVKGPPVHYEKALKGENQDM